MITNIKIPSDKQYLSEVKEFIEWGNRLPSHVLLNKGLTGCGGTTLELKAPRNSIILVPTISLVINKTKDKNYLFGLYGRVETEDLYNYLFDESIKYKKIVATYDQLVKLMNLKEMVNMVSIYDYFLLIDEYHSLFVSYKFRSRAIIFLLMNFRTFKDWCFLSATPLNQYNILKELEGIDIMNLHWEGKSPLVIEYTATEQALKVLEQRIYECLKADYNLHIFFNSFKSIRQVVKRIEDNGCNLDYRVVCSEGRADKNTLNYKSLDTEVCKVNFYTATVHDGCDIFDEKGKTIIVSDDTIVSTMMDISIHIIQIAGRLRNSMYINQLEWIFSSRKHRYLNKSEEEWQYFVFSNNEKAKEVMDLYESSDDQRKVVWSELDKKFIERASNRETYVNTVDRQLIQGYYVNFNNVVKKRIDIDGNERESVEEGMFVDDNLKMCDFENYRLFRSLNLLYTQNPKNKPNLELFRDSSKGGYKTIIEERAMQVLNVGKEYTRDELNAILKGKGIIKKDMYNKFIEDYFSKNHFSSKRKVVKGRRLTVYMFF